jgi:tetratricopeptide (TPR) repeat protein
MQESDVTMEQIEDLPSEGPETPAPRSPFGRQAGSRDDWIRKATYGVLVAIVLLGAYIAYMYLGDTRLASTQSPAARAVTNLAQVVAKAPSDPQARVKLAEAMMANSQTDDAIAQLRAAIELDKENITALTDLGLIAMDRREWKTAEGYWLQLVQLLSGAEMSLKDQRLANVYYYLGTTLVEQQRYEEAVANLKQSILIKRDESPVHYMLAIAYQRLGLPDMQKQELAIVVAFDPKQAQANYDIGMLDLAAGDVAAAAESFRIAADNAPTGVTAPQAELDKLDAAGSASVRMASAQRLRSSDPKKALSEARVAAALDPANPDAVALVAQLWEKNGDKARALNAWNRLLELVPGDVTATDAVKRLSAPSK